MFDPKMEHRPAFEARIGFSGPAVQLLSDVVVSFDAFSV
jgi:hypothetical protein